MATQLSEHESNRESVDYYEKKACTKENHCHRSLESSKKDNFNTSSK